MRVDADLVEKGKRMEQIVFRIKEQMKDKKCRIYTAVALLVTAALCVEFYLLEYSFLKILRYAVLAGALFLLAWIDQKSKRIPNKILAGLIAARIVILVFEWMVFPDLGLSLLFSSVAGALIGGGMFMVCYLISRGGIGAGDVKLFAVIGWIVGSGSILTVSFLTVMVSAGYSIIMLLLKKTSLKEEIPFAPFILVGTVLTMALGM